ncbi:MAG TPA: hypothetical protein VF804_13365 [Holophagaceae bacterium]
MNWPGHPGVLAAIVALAPAQARPAEPPQSGQSQGRMTDAQAAELAKGALSAQDPASIRAVLARLRGHAFRSSKVPEREVVLYAEGVLEARLGNLGGAAVSLRKLEKQWPRSPYTGESQVILAQDALARNRFPEAETRLHRALAADIPAEQKRRAQELMLWTLVQQGRPLEGLPIVQALEPMGGQEKPSERGLAAMAEVLCAAGEREQAEGVRKSLTDFYPASPLMARVELAYGQLLGRSGDAKASAEVLRKLIQDHPKAQEADDARLALASLLTDGSLPSGKDLPTAETLLAEIRKGGKGLPKGRAQLVELRLLTSKSLWEDALDLVDRMEPVWRRGQPEVQVLWKRAWGAWVDQRLEKGFAGELLARLKPGTFGALDAKQRRGVVELLAAQGLLGTLPALLPEAPAKERGDLRRAALAKADPQAQPASTLLLLPASGGTPGEALQRAQAEAARADWNRLRSSLGKVRPGPERAGLVTELLQRPLAPKETPAQRLREAEGWLARAPEKGAARESLAILVADLRFQAGDVKGALALYPPKPAVASQRGWVALMRAQALLRLGQTGEARAQLLQARDDSGFKGQRDALAKALHAY